ncbi:unnamed protein product [Caenorhabditis angaria]|uniref:Uncharacterized protein n=1 Tax=Caenorhabditis angaria TaxID=860376 RepID=A0A9P1NB38_9PELO|nr:unnamed protein product [Caenorhabditis angaria]
MNSSLRSAERIYTTKSVSFEEDTWPWYQKVAQKCRKLGKRSRRFYKWCCNKVLDCLIFILTDDEEEVKDSSEPVLVLATRRSSTSGDAGSIIRQHRVSVDADSIVSINV